MERWYIKSVFGVIMSLVLCYGYCGAQTRAWEGEIVIPTYGIAEDTNPKFWIMEDAPYGAETIVNSITYPYTMEDNIIPVKTSVTYKALFIENEYLKITCLPELNGKFHSVLDKSTGKEMFWVNPVIKPGLIAMRGAGIIGGKAFNAGPQVHTTTIMSRINSFIGKEEDGSVYIEVGNLDQTFRTRWKARVTLRPGRAYLEETISLSNPVDAVNPYYFWNNAALQNTETQRFVFPISLATFHDGKEFFTWPVFTGNDTKWLKGVQGRDMTWLKNYNSWAPIFAYKCAFDFFGAYDTGSSKGVVHFAERHALSGKKAWTWGNWEYGVESQKTLVDGSDTYIEVQSGPLATQSDYASLMPHEGISWTEYWYPIHGFKSGFEYANKDAAIETIRKGKDIEFRILGSGVFTGASFSIISDGSVRLEKQIDITPQKLAVIKTADPGTPLEVTIKSGSGQLLVQYETPLSIPKELAPEISEDNNEESAAAELLYLTGQKYDRASDRKKARAYYNKSLNVDPGYTLSLQAIGILDFESALYVEAASKFKTSLNRNTNDGLSWYFLGNCYLKDGNYEEAVNCASKIIQLPEYKALGYDLAGRAYLRQKEYSKAIHSFGEAQRINSGSLKAKEDLMLAYYADKQLSEAVNLAEETVSEHPYSLVPRSVIALQNEGEMDYFIAAFKKGLGSFNFEFQELCLKYLDLGLVDEALKLIESADNSLSKEEKDPMTQYYISFLHDLKKDQKAAAAYLAKIPSLNKDFIFASRPEEIPILKHAVRRNAKDAYAYFQLGNLYANLGRADEAYSNWQDALKTDPASSIVLRNLGLYEWKIKADLKSAEAFYQKAIDKAPQDQTLYRDLAQLLYEQKKMGEIIALLENLSFDTHKRSDISILLAAAYVDSKMYDKALGLLRNEDFVLWEGQKTPWVLFNKASIEKGLAEFKNEQFDKALAFFKMAVSYPSNMGVGRFDSSEEAPGLYWIGKSYAALGRLKEAEKAWTLGAAAANGSDTQNKHIELCKQELLKMPKQ